MDSNEILKETRKWIQWNCSNGDKVEWSSQDVLRPYITVDKLEKFAKDITFKLRETIVELNDQEYEIGKLKEIIEDLDNEIKELKK